MSENNQQVHWGTVVSIPVMEIPPQTTGKYLGLFQDACLRLENTPPTDALRYPFEDPKVLAAAHTALKKMFRGQPVEVVKRAGALFIYNTVAPANRRAGAPRGPRGPRKIGTSDTQDDIRLEPVKQNGRRLDLPDMAEMMGAKEVT